MCTMTSSREQKRGGCQLGSGFTLRQSYLPCRCQPVCGRILQTEKKERVGLDQTIDLYRAAVDRFAYVNVGPGDATV